MSHGEQKLFLTLSGKTIGEISCEIAVGITVEIILEDFLVKSMAEYEGIFGRNLWKSLSRRILEEISRSFFFFLKELLDPYLYWVQNSDCCQKFFSDKMWFYL